MQIRDALGHELTEAGEKIAAEEAGLGRFDIAFQEAEKESESAAEIVKQVTADLARVENEKKEIKSRSDEETNERHDLQVQLSKLMSFGTSLLIYHRPSNVK